MDFSKIETTARIREWQYLTGADFAELDREKTVVLLTCSPLEVHGPHLPVITDNIESEYISLKAAEILCAEHPELEILHLPPIYTAADVIPHYGSLMFRSSTITRVIEDLGRSLAVQGFKNIWISSFHGGPRHFIPIEIAADRVSRKYGVRMISMFSLLINRLTKGGTDLSDVLGEIDGIDRADLAGDSHAGLIETSMLLNILPDCVGPGWEKLGQRSVNIKLAEAGIPPIKQDNILDLLRGFKYKIKYYEDETYSGRPEKASRELGEEIIKILAAHSAAALGEIYTGKLNPKDCHSPIWPLRWLFASGFIGRIFEIILDYKNRVF